MGSASVLLLPGTLKDAGFDNDEPSALDKMKYIQAALQEVMLGRTTLVIAHRLSSESADSIVVMDKGR